MRKGEFLVKYEPILYAAIHILKMGLGIKFENGKLETSLEIKK